MPDPIAAADLRALMSESARAPRRRAHLLLHQSHSEPVQRLLVAAQPNTFFRPHRHPQQWELLTYLGGEIEVLVFDDAGSVVTRHELTAAAPVIQIAAGTWHTLLARAPDTVFLEVKPGPYRPSDFAPWAPEEGTADAQRMLAELTRAHG